MNVEINNKVKTEIETADDMPIIAESQNIDNSKMKKQDKGKKRFRFISSFTKVFLGIIISILSLIGLITVIVFGPFLKNNMKDVLVFIEIDKLIDHKFYLESNKDKQIEGILKGYVAGLEDPYSGYLNEEEATEQENSLNNNTVGVGVLLGYTENGEILIQYLFQGGAAIDSNLKKGDIITSVDGVTTEGLFIEDVSSKLRGEAGKTVKVEAVRGDGTVINEELTRKEYHAPFSVVKEIDGNTVYIGINSFGKGLTAELMENFQEMNLDNKNIILDLRDNGGGLVDEAKSVSDLFLDREIIYYEKYKGKDEKKVLGETGKVFNGKTVVLVNGGTASSSEILTGALKDNEVATVVGTKTFGKGVIQTVGKLINGSSLKLTVGGYLTPDKNDIHGKGIEPDVEIKDKYVRAIYEFDGNDPYIQKAVEILNGK